MPILTHIVVKPTLACTAKCPTCALRRRLHSAKKSGEMLGFERWREVFAEADHLGVSHLIISGGEPTLYEHLPELIREGKGRGWQVRVNTNGSLITYEYARTLLDAGLDIICISLYAADGGKMAAMRGNPSLWEKAVGAIRIFAGLEGDYPGFEIRGQTILTRQNLFDLPQLIGLHSRLGSRSLTLSYLEGDFENRHLPRMEDIRRFREETIPRALLSCGSLKPFVRLAARRNIERIFSPAMLAPSEWASGEYWDRAKPCHVPVSQAIILASGDVHPCNMVEYAHDPVAGNILEESLTDIWNGGAWRDFRKRRHEKCHLCPINLHSSIQLRPMSWVAVLYSLLFYNKGLSHKTNRLVSLGDGLRKRMSQIVPSLGSDR